MLRAPGKDREVLYESERTRVSRVWPVESAGSLIRKERLGSGALERSRHELSILLKLAGVPCVLGLVVGRGADELLFEDLRGMTLAELIRTDAPDITACVGIALQLARTVGAVHQAAVLHRDINPSNILVSDEGRPMLIDFDLATSFGDERTVSADRRQIIGTLPYLAPEQTGRTGMRVDERSDLYALGATIYELATGSPPFPPGDALRMVHDSLAEKPVPPQDRDPRVPRQLSDIVMRLLEKEPGRRYQSADGLAHDLSRLRDRLAQGRDEAFALGDPDFPLRLSAPSRLVGRGAEIAALRGTFEASKEGGGRGVLVTGAPGVGKSALVNALRTTVTAHGGWFVTGKFDQYGLDNGTGALAHALVALGRLLLACSEDELAATRREIIRAVGPNVALLAEIPGFAAVLDVATVRNPSLATGDPEILSTRMRQAALDLLSAVASPARPVVIAIDDLQWGGPVPVGFFEAVLADDRLVGVLMVGAYRDAEIGPTHPLAAALARWERLATPPTRLRLDNLRPADLADLLCEVLRLPSHQIGIDLAAAVGAHSAGNPFDTLVLLNALRRDRTLVISEAGWSWDAATIRRFVGQGDVVDLLTTRIDELPADSRRLLEILCCLGGEVELHALAVAAALTPTLVDEQLSAPLQDGLLVLEPGPSVRFRHDRVQQAARRRLDDARRQELQLVAARRLAAFPGCGMIAAQQYLQCVDVLQNPLVVHPGEHRQASELFVTAAAAAQMVNPVAAEHFLEAALRLLDIVAAELTSGYDDPLLVKVERHLHAVLYGLGRLAEADDLYDRIERRGGDPMDHVDPVCVQVASLSNRGRHRAAVALGLALLRRMGLDLTRDDFGTEAERQGDDLADWASSLVLADDLERPETGSRWVRVAATLVNRLQPTSFFYEPAITARLIGVSRLLWSEHGPCAPLVANLSAASLSTVTLRQDYRTGYAIAAHVLAIGEARAYEPETSFARHSFSTMARHWFEGLEDGVELSRRAREGLVQGGDLMMAGHTFKTSLAVMLDCSPTLDDCAADVESALAFAARTGNDHTAGTFLAYRQFIRSMRGETDRPRSFSDGDFDEAAHVDRLATNPMAAAYFHIYRALAAALFGDTAAMTRHAASAMPLLPYISGFYPTALAHLLHALGQAHLAKVAAPAQRPPLVAQLDSSLAWLTARSVDAPANFGHLAMLLRAERAWAVGDLWPAARAFDAAWHDVATRGRPWHRALISERAALFHFDNGIEQSGRQLLGRARDQFSEWGASGKVRQLEAEYPYLRRTAFRQTRSADRTPSAWSTSSIYTDEIDMVAILRASQALSTETSLDRLRARLGELLREMTGADTVLIALHGDGSDGWQIWETIDQVAGPVGWVGPVVSVPLTAAAGLLPLSAFRYVERTGHPLLVEDAVTDDRFARDPYLAGLERCSLLVIPIFGKGELRAVLILENRLRRGAFAVDGLDAVMLITGQLAVSLDNAQLYSSLERKVAERTAALEEANNRLEELSNTDALTGLSNRRLFDSTMDAEWRRAARQGTPLGLAIIDVDHFKLYNDRFGHVSGDECLGSIATALRDAVRGDPDVVCRYGGEEFAAILPGADEAGALRIAERIRAAVAALYRAGQGHETVRGMVTVSIGVAAYVPGVSTTAAGLVAAADAALYRAKTNGRNQIHAAGAAPER